MNLEKKTMGEKVQEQRSADRGKTIEVNDLYVTYNVRKKRKKAKNQAGDEECVHAVNGVTMDIRTGEILAVVGESGCGKTTLGKAILNIIRSSSGTIKYHGQDLSKLSGSQIQSLRQKMQLIFQDPYESLDPRQSVYKALEEPLDIHRKDMSPEQKKERIYKYLEAVGLHPAETMAQRYPHHLSGGQRQRLSIAATMILEPDFVVADEPVSMLDVSIRAEILKLMLDLQKGTDLTYMFITHDLSLAWLIADRIAVFYLGKLVEIGQADDVVHRCMHPYSQALVSVIPKIREEADEDKGHVLRGETPSPMSIPSGCCFHTRCWLYQEKGCPEVCRQKEPALVTVGGDHQAACHFAGPEEKGGDLHG